MGRVSVVFEMFKGMYEKQHMLQHRTNEALRNISEMRSEADKIIFDVWGEIETAFAKFDGEERLKKCAEYGVIYYDRPDRKKEKND